MPSPFPGMDPWLESPTEWPGFHDTLVIKTVEVLQPQLRSRGYYAKPGERVWLSQTRGVIPDVATIVRSKPGRPENSGTVAVAEPDEPVRITHAEFEVHEGFVEIYHASSDQLVASIEYLSPTNKTDRQGRALYLRKQEEFRNTLIHLVEIDLIRRGPHVLDIPEEVVEELRPWEYLVNIARRNSNEYEVYPIKLRDRLPRICIPLKIDDNDATLDLQEVFEQSYDMSPFPERSNYDSPPPAPQLTNDDLSWAGDLLKSKGLR